MASLSRIGGSAPGATQVLVALRRGDGQFWNGQSYQRAPFFARATLQASTWTLTGGLPGGANLPLGRYSIEARASDQAGNTSSVVRTVIVESSPAG